MSMFAWKLVEPPPPGVGVMTDERLSWPKTAGVGAQHVVAMFGGTFVFPVIMGLDPNLALMFSGICTIAFLMITRNRIPSYLGTSASFVASVAAIRAQGGDSAHVTGAIMIAGIVLALIGVFIHYAGVSLLKRVLPPAVTGAVVMLIGFNLAPVVAGVYWPQDPTVGILTVLFVVLGTVLLRGFLARVTVFLGLIFGMGVSMLFDNVFGKITSPDGTGEVTTRFRVNLDAVGSADWFGLPSGKLADGVSVVHAPSLSLTFTLLVLPAVIALIAENTGHVRAIGEMTGEDLDPYMGRAIGADGAVTAVASLFGGSPTTTYADNMGVMAATRVYSTAAYYAAGLFAIILGLCPKVGAFVYAIPGGVLGGITLVLYGMIGLIGAKIWVDNGVDFANPVNMVPLAAGLVAGIGNVTLPLGGDFELTGIALGTILVIVLHRIVARFGTSFAQPELARRQSEEPAREPERAP